MSASPADSLRVLFTRAVHSRSEASWKALRSPYRLGPLDLMMAPYPPVAILFVYRKPAAQPLLCLDRLQLAMRALLDYYPQLTGRLHLDAAEDGVPLIRDMGAGAEFRAAECAGALADFSLAAEVSMRLLPQEGNALFAPFDSSLEGVPKNAILSVQHTRFRCGGVALGVRIPHRLVDAGGLFQVVGDWAFLYRALEAAPLAAPALLKTPHFLPYLAHADGTDKAALSFTPELFRLEPLTEPQTPTACAAEPTNFEAFANSRPVTGRFIRFSAQELEALKTRATAPDKQGWISTFEALAAHLYQRIHLARLRLRREDPTLPKLTATDFLTAVNVRHRIGLPERYSSNAVIAASREVSPELLEEGELWQVARKVHELTRASSVSCRREMTRSLEWIALQEDKAMVSDGFRRGSGSFIISQWSKFDMYGICDFNCRPALVSTPFTEDSLVDGLAYLLPTGGSGDGIQVSLSLDAALWELLDQDPLFKSPLFDDAIPVL